MCQAANQILPVPCPVGLEYLPYQLEGIEFARSRNAVLFGDEPGLGKQQPVDAKVLTPTGWREIGMLRPGDKVIGSEGRAVTVTGVFPQGVKPSYRITMSDGASVEAGPEHLWTVLYRRGGKTFAELTVATLDLLNRPVLPTSKKGLDLAKTPLYIPMLAGPVEFDDAPELPIAPYTLGQMIANGYLLGSSASITSNLADGPEIIANLRAEGSPIGAIYTNPRQSIQRVCINSKTIVKVREMGLAVKSGEKFIPDPYKRASVSARVALLRGLMDGDGSITPERNRVVYHTTSAILAQDVAELVEQLGGISTVREYVRHDGKPTDYQVRMRMPGGLSPFSIARKASRYRPGRNAYPVRTVKSVEYIREVESVCIAVDAPDQLYTTEHCILTHNTIQAIGWLNCHPRTETLLVVCPASLKINWHRELDKWLISPCVDVTIINYDVLHKLDMTRHWDVCIIDEAHAVKNRKAKRTVLCKQIQADVKLALTGTPILNKPVELWSILNWLAPEIWPKSSFMRYAYRYCGAYQGKWGMVMDGATHLDELRMHLSYLMTRHLKADVLKQLPPKRRQIIEISKDGLSADLRARLADAARSVERIEDTYKDDAGALESALSVAWKDMAELRHEVGLAKVGACLDLIHDAIESSGKVIVFAHHRDVIAALNDALVGYMPAVIHGGIPVPARQDAVDRFQTDDECKVFIGQIQAAGVGLTLTASSHVIFVELDWTPGIVSQAEDRAHRIGQRGSVLIQHVVMEGGFDARMVKALVRKQMVIEKALDA